MLIACILLAVFTGAVLHFFFNKQRSSEILWIGLLALCFAAFLVSLYPPIRQKFGEETIFRWANAALFFSATALYLFMSFFFRGRIGWHNGIIIGILLVLVPVDVFGNHAMAKWSLTVFHIGAAYTMLIAFYQIFRHARRKSWYKMHFGIGILLLCVGGLLDIMIIRGWLVLPRTLDFFVLGFIGTLLLASRKKTLLSGIPRDHASDYSERELKEGDFHLMIVDDSSPDRQFYAALFQGLKNPVLTREKPAEALDNLPEGKLVVIADFHLSGRNGADLTREIRKRNTDCHVLGLSADISESIIAEFLGAGADRVLFKPARPDRLKMEILALVRKNSGKPG